MVIQSRLLDLARAAQVNGRSLRVGWKSSHGNSQRGEVRAKQIVESADGAFA
jgi:hypothetical protein